MLPGSHGRRVRLKERVLGVWGVGGAQDCEVNDFVQPCERCLFARVHMSFVHVYMSLLVV